MAGMEGTEAMNIHEEFVREIDQEIERLQLVREYHISKIPEVKPPAQQEVARQLPQKHTAAVTPTKGHPDNAEPQDVGSSPLQRHQMAESILRTNGGPMTTGAILRRARDLGWIAGDGDNRKLTNAFFTAMTRNEKFFKPEPGLFALREWQVRGEKSE